MHVRSAGAHPTAHPSGRLSRTRSVQERIQEAKPKVVILSGGPNSVHVEVRCAALRALRAPLLAWCCLCLPAWLAAAGGRCCRSQPAVIPAGRHCCRPAAPCAPLLLCSLAALQGAPRVPEGFFDYCQQHQIPVLGICYGMQVGGRVACSKGWQMQELVNAGRCRSRSMLQPGRARACPGLPPPLTARS